MPNNSLSYPKVRKKSDGRYFIDFTLNKRRYRLFSGRMINSSLRPNSYPLKLRKSKTNILAKTVYDFIIKNGYSFNEKLEPIELFDSLISNKFKEPLSDSYLKTRKNLRRVFLLIDSRRNIMSIDNEIMDIMDDYAVSYQIVLTKADKILKVENLAELVLKEVEKRKAIFPKILITSSKSKFGIDDIREEIASLFN